MRKYLILLCIALIPASLSVCLRAAQLTRDGQALAVIVCPADATVPEQNAAKELAAYIEQISGAALPIRETASDTDFNICVGQTGAVKSLAGDFDWESLKGDGILIRSGKNYLILAGDRPRGTLYAVYTFLEDHLGVRFWSPDAEKVPE
ncbi:MAG: hypothetical protein J5758_02315, partial [Abditibacteriota bacterium]|nr:hypothetical protein [Abditibacteriota bacterium]